MRYEDHRLCRPFRGRSARAVRLRAPRSASQRCRDTLTYASPDRITQEIIAETQELLDFCARKSILPESEMIRVDGINEAFERMERGDVRYRFVIDMSSLPATAPDAKLNRALKATLGP